MVYIIDEVLHLSERMITSWWTKGLEENIQIDENMFRFKGLYKVPTKTVLVHNRELKVRQKLGKGKISWSLYPMVRNLDYVSVK